MVYVIQCKVTHCLMKVGYSENGWWMYASDHDFSEYEFEDDAYHDLWCWVTDKVCAFDDYEIVEV